MNLLWERLARVLGSLSQPDSLAAYKFNLIEINVDLTPFKRKHDLFGVQYLIRAESCNPAFPADYAVVVDLFPSASAVNIVDTKYRENRVGLAAVLSWFSVGLNASYNRDHLQMSQALGQSAYITGYGIGTNRFGWIFGANLGDDTVTPGNRTVFALIAIPSVCNDFSVRVTNAAWFKGDTNAWYHDDQSSLSAPVIYPAYVVDTGLPVLLVAPRDQAVTSISYTPADYDPTGAAKTAMSVELTMARPIDPQQTISVNGKIIKRSRDAFGRAVASSGPTGLLETQTTDANSWIPTSSTSLMMTLDPSGFGRHFPDIEIASPSLPQALSVSAAVNAGAHVTIGGRTFNCSPPACPDALPALGYPKAAAPKQLLVSHWRRDPSPEKLLITVASDQQPASTPTASPASVPTLQILSNQPTWGGASVVLVSIPGGTYRFNCTPQGSRLICSSPAGVSLHDAMTVEVIDPDHVGGGIRAFKTVPDCASDPDCLKPLVWNLGQPQWQAAGGHQNLNLTIEAINFAAGGQITLKGGVNNVAVLGGGSQACVPDPNADCSVMFTVGDSQFANVTDQMLLEFGGATITRATLQYLRSNSEPLLTGISDPQTLLTGQNLNFSTLRVGENGSPMALNCVNGTECHLASGVTYPSTASGYLYFLTVDSIALPVLLVKNGAISAVYHDLPPKKGATASAAGTAGAPQPVVEQKPTVGTRPAVPSVQAVQ